MIILARWQLGPVINICILLIKCEVSYIMFVGCHLQINKTRIYAATFIILPSGKVAVTDNLGLLQKYQQCPSVIE